MFFHPNEEDGRVLFKKKLRYYTEEHSKTIELPIHMNVDIADEAFSAAYASAGTHNLGYEHLNHFKELAHLGYWIAQLKPLVIPKPESPERIIEWADIVTREDGDEEERDLPKPSERALAGFEEVLRRTELHGAYPVNELVALEFIYVHAEIEFRRKTESGEGEVCEAEIKAAEGGPTLAEIAVRQAYFQEKLHGRMRGELALAMRHHGFTPRAFATLVDTLFAFEGFGDD